MSEAIRKLEIELDVPLIERGHKFEGLTAEGAQIVRWAETILDNQKSLRHTAASLRSGVTGMLRLGVVPTASVAAADITAPLSLRHPLIHVRIHGDLSSRDIETRLNRFELEGGITYVDDGDASRHRIFPLYRERYALLTADDPNMPRGSTASWSDAATLPMCTLPSNMRVRRILDETFARHGASPVAHIETDSLASLYAHVKTGRWVSVVPRRWVEVLGDPPGTRSTPLEDTLDLPAPMIGLITRAEAPSVVTEALQEVAATLDRTSSEIPIEE
ncbi:DNA-binding transcriptional LysR family regulator [Rhodococcus sp. PvP016]|uniref:DNA-binding transcriptional LysR family regulator n=1 Tax=Rhodococcoides corynebacterioides TaxID=53972 RepID=A0ABS2KZJ8_9NOCA|nr:DNA-binding transcriptional LysR family regulator [Rhodococcus corynebacterioides]MBP1115605.1 DNA-binding transcriptional LysR family regulator [Rhodococcus sp. PvP016]